MTDSLRARQSKPTVRIAPSTLAENMASYRAAQAAELAAQPTTLTE